MPFETRKRCETGQGRGSFSPARFNLSNGDQQRARFYITWIAFTYAFRPRRRILYCACSDGVKERPNSRAIFRDTRISPMNITFEINSIVIPDRVELSYVRQGNPAGVPVLFLHGLTDSWRSFEPVLPHLPENIHAIALSQRGHGDSSRPAGGYRTRDFAADAAAFLKSLVQGPAIVVGHSMGSTNALRFAIDFPELTRGLVLVGSFARYRGNQVIEELWDAVSQLTDPIDPVFALEFQQGTLAQPVTPAFLDVVVQESLKVPARIWRAALQGLMEDDFVGEISRIKTPTRLLWGNRDTLCLARDQEVLLDAIEGSKLVVFEGAGHALHWEEAARFAAEVVDFVDGNSRRCALNKRTAAAEGLPVALQ